MASCELRRLSLNAGGAVFTTPDTLSLATLWFAGAGGTSQAPSAAIAPGITTVALERSRAPLTTEWAAGLGGRLGRVELRTDLVWRDSGALRARAATPGTFSIDEIGQAMDTGVPERRDGLWRKSAEFTLQGQYRIGLQVTAGAALSPALGHGGRSPRRRSSPSCWRSGNSAYFDEVGPRLGDLRSIAGIACTLGDWPADRERVHRPPTAVCCMPGIRRRPAPWLDRH